MFNRLPTELVRQIIESTVPSTYHSKTYGDRQATLRSLCLACRLFRGIAQPILRQVVVINDGNSHAHSVIDQFTEPPRQVVVMVPTWDQLLDLAISNGSRIRDLTIDVGLGRSDAPLPIQHFMELRTLRLYSEAALSDSLSLPHLKGLTIGGKRQVYLFTRFLTRSNFPSLRALAFTHANSDCLRSILGHSPALSLILSLDAFFVNNLRDPETIIGPLETVLSSTLVTCNEMDDALRWESTVSKSLHLRLSGISDESAFRKLATNIESSTQSPLTSLYLDASCSLNIARTGEEVARSELRRLVAACDARGVEVVYEEGPANWVLDPVISPEFWRRQREFRREQAVSP